MFDSLLKTMHLSSQDIGIDLGTSHTIIGATGKGIVVMEPSYVTRHKKTRDILAVGSQAKRMMGKTPQTIEVIRPLEDGVIADFDATEAMLRHYMRVLMNERLISPVIKPRVVIGVPSGVTEVERRAVRSVVLNTGAREVYLIEEAMAAAIGAGLNVVDSDGHMIVDIGGGTSEIAVISMGGVVAHRSLPIAGDELDQAVQSFLRARYGLLVGDTTAEQIKIELGSAAPFEGKQHLQVVARGRSLESGLPQSIKVGSVEVREALAPVIQQILAGILETLEETPPELVSDVLKHGIVLSGGTSQLRGLDGRVSEETHIQSWIAEEPQMAVVRGCLKVLEDTTLLKKVRVTGGLQS